jgi:hypothetical protein
MSEQDSNFYAVEYLKCRRNPFYFIYNYVYIPEIGGSLKLDDTNLHYKMKRVVKSLIKYRRVILMASRQSGKALDITTKIPLADNTFKLMKDIEIGDFILDEFEFPTEVIAVTSIMYDRPCYKFIFENAEEIIADANHLWKVSSYKYDNELKTSKELFNEKYDPYDLCINVNDHKICIRYIIETESVPVKCIQVRNTSGMFLCGETKIPTHNSTIAAAMLLWAANFYSNLPIVILNMRVASGLANLNIIKFMYNHLPDWLKSPYRSKSERKTYIEFQNGSVIKTFSPSPASPPEQLARGLTAPILYIDECAFIRHIGIAYRSAQPIISKASEQAIANGYPSFIAITSTPNGTFAEGEFFYNMWNNSISSDELFDEEGNFISNSDECVNDQTKNGFISAIYHWSEDPSKDEAWYQKQKRELNFDTRSINQELDLLFIGSTTCIFDDDFLSKLSPAKPIDILQLGHFSKLKMYEEINNQDYYIIGVDTAKSLTGDFCAIEIFSYKDFKQVGEYFGRIGSLTKYSEVVEQVIKLVDKQSNSRYILAIENNSIGSVVIEYLENCPNKNYMNHVYGDKEDKFIYGINTNSKTKDTMISIFYDYINTKPTNLKSLDLINQLSVIEKKSNGSISSKHGHNDDLFMAASFCAYLKKMTLLTIEPLLNYSEEDINKEEEYLITHMAYSNTNTDKNDSSLRTELFPDVNSYIYASEKELLNSEDYDNSDDLLDYISL